MDPKEYTVTDKEWEYKYWKTQPPPNEGWIRAFEMDYASRGSVLSGGVWFKRRLNHVVSEQEQTRLKEKAEKEREKKERKRKKDQESRAAKRRKSTPEERAQETAAVSHEYWR